MECAIPATAKALRSEITAALKEVAEAVSRGGARRRSVSAERAPGEQQLPYGEAGAWGTSAMLSVACR